MANEQTNFFAQIDAIPDEVPYVDWEDLNKKNFFKDYLSKSKPVLIKGYAQ